MAKKRTRITPQAWFNQLENPNNVGTSEYRAIHELLKDVVDGFDAEDSDEDNLSHLDGVLDEVLENAKSLKEDLALQRAGLVRSPAPKTPFQLSDEGIRYRCLNRACDRGLGEHTPVFLSRFEDE